MLQAQKAQVEFNLLQKINQEKLDQVCDGPAIAESVIFADSPRDHAVQVFNVNLNRVELVTLSLVSDE